MPRYALATKASLAQRGEVGWIVPCTAGCCGHEAGALPGGHWENLFPRALALIDEISRYCGITDPFWTLGGGTVLMFREVDFVDHSNSLLKDAWDIWDIGDRAGFFRL